MTLECDRARVNMLESAWDNMLECDHRARLTMLECDRAWVNKCDRAQLNTLERIEQVVLS